LTVAMLGAIESLLSAVVADRMSGRRHNSNVELFAQGIANIVSPMVGGLPATQPATLMNAAEFHRHVGAENILPHVEAALKRAAEIFGSTGPRQPLKEPPAA
jgi:MFS superfamily sulfate permease-like transporter